MKRSRRGFCRVLLKFVFICYFLEKVVVKIERREGKKEGRKGEKEEEEREKERVYIYCIL